MAFEQQKLSERINEYILVWGGTVAEPIYFDGSSFLVPARDEVASVNKPGTRFRHECAYTRRKSEPIPGTIVVRDVYAMVDGANQRVFDAFELVTHLERNRGELLQRGLAIVTFVDQVPEAMEACIPKFEASQDRRAQEVLQQELLRRQRWEKDGVPPPVSSSEAEVEWAKQHLEKRNVGRRSSVSTQDIRAALAGAPLPPAPVGEFPAKKTLEDMDVTGLFELATNMSIKLKPADMAALLLKDPDAITSVKKLIEAKKQELQKATEFDEQTREPVPTQP